MTQGKKVSEDLSWVVIRMTSMFSIAEVSAFTGLSIRKIRSIQAVHRKTGDVVVRRDPKRGKPKALSAEDADGAWTKPVTITSTS
ncbi:hypothetical protein M422DRAFT_253206 [Sphaerobolus stellatus SS14]|uniref:Uncharacterized protein n=1 Tax=Sphaerobolus stellatus (strain SS14) TaxID=990650 RepID=A0A0C9VXK1_SPHS4|nr:hypothetical protein M422DRAFT_253206 [Sphaerobolus stellatus SS14]